MSVAENIKHIEASLPTGVALIAVSKFHSAKTVQEAYDAGHRRFGESRAQEVKTKRLELPDDIEWHFIGTLQSNKVKDIAGYVSMIHSVDSLKLLKEIDRQAEKHQRTIRVLLEIHLAEEETKHGMSPDECVAMLHEFDPKDYPFVEISGLMCMATDTDDSDQIRNEFRQLRLLFEKLKEDFFRNSPAFREISMGMSHDYPIAIEEGSTMIRVGTSIFGEREY